MIIGAGIPDKEVFKVGKDLACWDDIMYGERDMVLEGLSGKDRALCQHLPDDKEFRNGSNAGGSRRWSVVWLSFASGYLR